MLSKKSRWSLKVNFTSKVTHRYLTFSYILSCIIKIQLSHTIQFSVTVCRMPNEIKILRNYNFLKILELAVFDQNIMLFKRSITVSKLFLTKMIHNFCFLPWYHFVSRNNVKCFNIPIIHFGTYISTILNLDIKRFVIFKTSTVTNTLCFIRIIIISGQSYSVQFWCEYY